MRNSLIARLDAKSVIVGIVFATGAGLFAGAGKPDDAGAKVLPVRFLVLESSAMGKPGNGYQSQLLTICPYYGKIDSDSLKVRLSNETQEIKLILQAGEGFKVARGDIIGFDSFQHLKLSPGARVVRHLPDGGHELVP
jgi:hypothetical protein